MGIKFKYRGRVVNDEEVVFIQGLIDEHPDLSRRALSKLLCEAWNWRQANGALRDMVCRGLMLGLHRAGHITLPEVRVKPNNPFLKRSRPPKLSDMDESSVEMKLSELGELEIKQVRKAEDEGLLGSLIETYHYLGYTQPVGEHLKYMIYAGQRPVACFIWCSAVRHLSSRDTYIGWDKKIREKNLHLIAYNTRFLIMPWVRVPHLASHLLGRISRRLSCDWENLYHHPVYFLETFVEPPRYMGTCYRAANWVSMGVTTGRGKNDQTNKANRSIKEVLGYSVKKNFRKHLLSP